MFKEIIYNIILTTLIPTIFILSGMGIRYGLAFLKLKLSNTRLGVAVNWIDKLVTAAEQKFNSEGSGSLKKQFVSEAINKILAVLKVNFSLEEVDALIEASVKELNDTTALIANSTPTDTVGTITKEDVKTVIDDALDGAVDTISGTITGSIV